MTEFLVISSAIVSVHKQVSDNSAEEVWEAPQETKMAAELWKFRVEMFRSRISLKNVRISFVVGNLLNYFVRESTD